MARGTAYIIGAGNFCTIGFKPGPGDIIIAADGGFDRLNRAGIRPHLLIGDMDSIQTVPPGIARLRFPAHKDDTDLALAIKAARRLGYERFKLYGALGGRLDHTLANLQLLADLAQTGCQARVIDQDVIIYAVHEGTLTLPPIETDRTISVFSWTNQTQGVTLKGLAYSLFNATLANTKPLGVSNAARGKPINISVKSGTLMVMLANRAYE